MKKLLVLSIVFAFVLVFCLASVSEAASFQGLGSVDALDVSADGSVVVGSAGRWTASGGWQALAGVAYGVSADGSFVAGRTSSEAFRWSLSEGTLFLGDLPGGNDFSEARGVSGDGSVLVGCGHPEVFIVEAFRWTEGEGMAGLGILGDPCSVISGSVAMDICDDGSVIVGISFDVVNTEAFLWTESNGMVGLGDLPGGDFVSESHAVSSDGSIVVGKSSSASAGWEAFKWTASSNMQGLGKLPGAIGSTAHNVSDDGTIVVGQADFGGGILRAFIWDSENGMRNLKDVLENDYGLDLTNWILETAWSISDDGLTIVGEGTNPIGQPEGWLANISAPPPYILLSSSQFYFYADEGGENPDEKELAIWNGGIGTLNWEIAEDCTWLEIDPNSGSSTSEPNVVTLAVDISGLPGGLYECDLIISDPNAWNSPQYVTVSLVINDGDGILHVPSEYGTIQMAIDIAGTGETVLVAEGTYIENITFDGKNIILTSTDPEEPNVVADTIIDGGSVDTVVRFNGTETSDCKLLGFTITNGYGPANSDGGGITGPGSATISRCIIRDNVAQRHGGGIRGVNGLIDRCIITGNSTVNRNAGGITGCHGTISNCLVYNNTATLSGGGMVNCDGDIVNCTIAGNTAGTDTGGIGACSGTITNCIIWDNSGTISDQIINSSTPTYSCIQYWWGGGTGNISIDPLFADPNNGDYHLSVHSECINAGDPCSNYTNQADIDGDTRVLCGRVDIGADEVVSKPGDFELDCDVDEDDLVVLVLAWLSESGDDNWNPDCDISDPNDEVIDGRDFAVFAMYWDGCGDPPPEPGMSFNIEDCDPGAKSAAGDKDSLRFSATVDGNYILFEDMMEANCCPDELLLEMTVEDDLITIYEIEHTTMPCDCICDWPVTATLGPFGPGSYTLQVYEDWGGFIGSTIVTIE